MKQRGWWLALVATLGIMIAVFTSCAQDPILSDEDSVTQILENDPTLLDEQDVQVCIDKRLPFGDYDTEKAAVIKSRLWNVGQTVRVRFLGGDAYVQGKVMQYAKMWEEYANVKFEQVTKGTADIHVGFNKDDGSWSYIGKDAMYLPQDSATMNFGWFDHKTSDTEFRRTTLHEFGHALGMIHEHQHPVAGIPWDTTKVYEYYMKPPNSWSENDVNRNIFEHYNKYQTQFCSYDAKSIMHYPVPEALTVGNFRVGLNTNLSDEDKRFVGKMYPFSGVRGTLKCKTYEVPPAAAARALPNVAKR
ncbi:MAG: matrixin family metalloprotease [Saprospiraceae bacterium]